MSPSRLADEGSTLMSERPMLLLVEDDEVVRRALTRALRAEGVEVHEAATADEALARLRADPYDAVVADYHLGERSGAWLLEQLERLNPKTMRVLITGDEALAMQPLAERGVFHAQLTKPFAVGALVERLRLRVQKRQPTLRDFGED
jgi:DNA-binding NtrC family response regulator